VQQLLLVDEYTCFSTLKEAAQQRARGETTLSSSIVLQKQPSFISLKISSAADHPPHVISHYNGKPMLLQAWAGLPCLLHPSHFYAPNGITCHHSHGNGSSPKDGGPNVMPPPYKHRTLKSFRKGQTTDLPTTKCMHLSLAKRGEEWVCHLCSICAIGHPCCSRQGCTGAEPSAAPVTPSKLVQLMKSICPRVPIAA
jgi:hypothetical protein